MTKHFCNRCVGKLNCCGLLLILLVLAVGGRCEAQERPKSEAGRSLDQELPRVPPVEPENALATFQIEQGFRLEMFACEPDVSDPVDACFDAEGRMYVAEMHGYPFSAEPTAKNPLGGGRPNAGIIRLLEDTDGDGRVDRSVRFADRISWPTSVCSYDGGVFALSPPHLYYFKDTDGDRKADVRKIVFSGFGRQNVQALANNMKWGLDNRIYAAGGRNSGELTRDGQAAVQLGGQDFRFDPATEDIEPVTGGVQFGHSLDDWGNRFVCSNSNHAQHVLFPYEYLSRNPYYAVSGAIRTIAKEGPAAPVFRRSPPEPWRVVRTRWRLADPEFRKRLSRTERFAVGFFTSASGITIYRGDAYPEDFHGNLFVGDVGGNLVHRKRVVENGVSFTAVRADEETEFITSTDNWFRPVNFVNAPDGRLYILDMYRETIEHPASIPEEIKTHLDLESGHDRGRIYRLVAPNAPARKPAPLSNAATEELVALLDSPNGWTRETAQRLLWERQDRAAVPLLERLAVDKSSSPFGRLHALWALHGLDALSPELIARALCDPNPRVREHAIRLSEKHLMTSEELVQRLAGLVDDEAPRVRFQLAFSLGEARGKQAIATLARLARNSHDDRDIRQALLTSVGECAGPLAVELIQGDGSHLPHGLRQFVAELAGIVAAGRGTQPSIDLLAAATDPTHNREQQWLVVRALGDGLYRRGTTFSGLLENLSAEAPIRVRLKALFEEAADVAADGDQPLPLRTAAAELLAFADFVAARAPLLVLLDPQQPQKLQLTAVRALSRHADSSVGELLLEGWRGFTPSLRREVVDEMLRSLGRIDLLLAAVESERIQPAELERDKKQQLLTHPNEQVRERSKMLFGGEVSTDRAKVVAAYKTVLDLDADAERGRPVFEKHCSACHRVGNVGHAVGPDLASTQNKSVGDLIVTILDPNREAQPNYTTYSVFTRQGRIFTGMIAQETATSLTLRRAEGKEDVILRNNIETLVSSGKSLMPEGLEKEITVQQMADLIAFVRTIRPAKTLQPGTP